MVWRNCRYNKWDSFPETWNNKTVVLFYSFTIYSSGTCISCQVLLSLDRAFMFLPLDVSRMDDRTLGFCERKKEQIYWIRTSTFFRAKFNFIMDFSVTSGFWDFYQAIICIWADLLWKNITLLSIFIARL